MLSAKTLSLVDFAVAAGFNEERVLELFGLYVAEYVDGNLDDLEEQIEHHGEQFMEYVQADFDGSTAPLSFASNRQPKGKLIRNKFCSFCVTWQL